MTKRNLTYLTTGLLLAAGLALAADPAPQTEETQVYGSQLMTRQERAEHRAKMRAARSVEERQQIRSEQHASMKQRAQERGLVIAETPPAFAGGMGPGPAGGMRMGYGGGRYR